MLLSLHAAFSSMAASSSFSSPSPSPSSATCVLSHSPVYCYFPSSSSPLSSSLPSSSMYPSILLFLIFSLCIVSVSFLYFFLLRRIKTIRDLKSETLDKPSISSLKLSLSKLRDNRTHPPDEQIDLTQFPKSLLVELLPNSPKWVALLSNVKSSDNDNPIVNGPESGESGGDGDGGSGEKNEEDGVKRKKKRAKKKNKQNLADSTADDVDEERRGEKQGVRADKKEDLVCLYPFTSSSSATQRKIKQQYDQLVKSHESKGLTLGQVGEFVNCLVDARSELQQKSELIHRKFSITKALLLKANRSSFDRIRQQVNRLELEQKRLEEDAFVYNWLQHQLKLSPAYKKMLESRASMDLQQAKSSEPKEKPDTESSDISFEELLAQEKKDSFWQKHGKLRPSSK